MKERYFVASRLEIRKLQLDVYESLHHAREQAKSMANREGEGVVLQEIAIFERITNIKEVTDA